MAFLDNDGTNMGGFLTNYALTFTLTKYLKNNSWFRLDFPTDYTRFGTVVCVYANRSTPIDCSLDGNTLIFSNIPMEFLPGTYKFQIKNIYNPYVKGLTKSFSFESLEPGTNTMVEGYEILGVSISTGTINNPSISGSPLNKNLKIEYTISFTPMNTIKEGGCINITFPPEFGALDSSCRVTRGLISGSLPLTCSSFQKNLTITNFADFIPQYIELKIQATNPGTSGSTSQFQISTYNKITGLYYPVDENLQAGQITISDVDNPYYLQIDLYRAYTNSSLDTVKPLDFRLYPQRANVLPITPSYGV